MLNFKWRPNILILASNVLEYIVALYARSIWLFLLSDEKWNTLTNMYVLRTIHENICFQNLTMCYIFRWPKSEKFLWTRNLAKREKNTGHCLLSNNKWHWTPLYTETGIKTNKIHVKIHFQSISIIWVGQVGPRPHGTGLFHTASHNSMAALCQSLWRNCGSLIQVKTFLGESRITLQLSVLQLEWREKSALQIQHYP